MNPLLRRFQVNRTSAILMFFLFFLLHSGILPAQTEIAWQKTIGTELDDSPLRIITDDDGHHVVIGLEPHEDFTGLLRPYMVVLKLDENGQEIWKTYHDVAFNTFSPPVDYGVGQHFYTEEFGEKLLNLVVTINNQTLLYKIQDETGLFYYHEIISSPVIDVNLENEKVYAYTLCSIQQSCYGPDSLVVERFDPSPDSIIFNPIVWTYALKQNIRTAPIQGHYDFDVQDIRVDDEGYTYLLVQIERWDFQFCTDCADAFIDAWCEIFRFDPQGQLIRHVNLKTAKAVVSHMSFVDMDDQSVMVQINDINAAGTKVIASVHRLDKELDMITKFDLDDAYTLVHDAASATLYAFGQKLDEANPAIHGLTDIVMAVYASDGEPAGRHYFGGSSWEFLRGVTLGSNGFPVFLARTDSDDFDVEAHIGREDMWIVQLAEEGTTSTYDPLNDEALVVFPNPCSDYTYMQAEGLKSVSVFDARGMLMDIRKDASGVIRLDFNRFTPGLYFLRAEDGEGKIFVGKVLKQ